MHRELISCARLAGFVGDHRMKRREFVTLLGSTVAWPVRAQAQQAARVRRLGVLSQDPVQAHPTPPYQAFQQGLRELGWVDGQNLAIEWRFSSGKADLLPRLATELLDLPVDLLVPLPTPPPPATAAA